MDLGEVGLVQALESAATDHRVVVGAVVVFAISYALIATEKVHRVSAALGGVAAMTALGLVDRKSVV